jgi:hypothetical protein
MFFFFLFSDLQESKKSNSTRAAPGLSFGRRAADGAAAPSPELARSSRRLAGLSSRPAPTNGLRMSAAVAPMAKPDFIADPRLKCLTFFDGEWTARLLPSSLPTNTHGTWPAQPVRPPSMDGHSISRQACLLSKHSSTTLPPARPRVCVQSSASSSRLLATEIRKREGRSMARQPNSRSSS